MVQAIGAEGGPAPFQGMEIERLGWIDGPQVRRMYERMTGLYRAGDEDYGALSWTLWVILAMELWIQAVTGRPETAENRAVVSGEIVVQ